MVRIVVLGDTHIPQRRATLPSVVLKACEQADIIVHLGDFTSIDVLYQLRKLATVHAVRGNNDEDRFVAELPLQASFAVNDTTFGLLHGHVGGRTARDAAERASREYPAGSVVLFGHSHEAYCETFDGRLLFNPGSSTDKRWSKARSFGAIEVDTEIRPSILSAE